MARIGPLARFLQDMESDMSGYIDIAGGYSYAPLRVGLVVRNPDGREVYCQPGDDAAAMQDNIDALDEIPAARRAVIADMLLGEYFA